MIILRCIGQKNAYYQLSLIFSQINIIHEFNYKTKIITTKNMCKS